MNTNTLQLKQTDGAMQVKAGDFGSRFAFQLLDEQGNLMEELNGQTAGIKLVQFDSIIYERDALVENSEVAFHFDKVLPAGKYWLEIWVDGYIFPSDRETKITVIKAAKGREETPKKLPPVRDLAGNPVTKVVIHDTINYYRDYPNAAVILVNPDNTIEYADHQNISVRKTELSDVDVVTISATGQGFGETVDALEFMVAGESYRLDVEVVRTPSPTPPVLETNTIVLNAENGFKATLALDGLVEQEGEMVTVGIMDQENRGVSAFYNASAFVINAWNTSESWEAEMMLLVHHGRYADQIPITVKVEAAQ